MKGKKPRTTRKTPVRQVRETGQGERPGNVVRLEHFKVMKAIKAAKVGFLFMSLSDLFQREV